MQKFELNTPDVSAELFDNEILAINLKSGQYHSLRQSAVPFWQMLVDGNSSEFAISELSKYYNVEVSAIKPDFEELLSALIENNLIREGGESTKEEDYQKYCTGGYQKPLFEIYSDMKELLLMDPIHEVDVTGWPNQKVD